MQWFKDWRFYGCLLRGKFKAYLSVVAALPGEFTVMSGRRMRNMLKVAAVGYPISNVALSGLNNMYTHYVTTPEEYQGQS